jgi:CBS domain containing-hemolysin-like protein
LDEKAFLLVLLFSIAILVWLYRGAFTYIFATFRRSVTRKIATVGCGLLLVIAGLSTFFARLFRWLRARDQRSSELRKESRRLELESQRIFEKIKNEHHRNDELRDDLRANLNRMHDFINKE